MQLNFEQIVNLVLQLPQEQAIELEKVLKTRLKPKPNRKKKPKQPMSDFQKLLLTGPVMSAEEAQRFEENRQIMNQFRSEAYDFSGHVGFD